MSRTKQQKLSILSTLFGVLSILLVAAVVVYLLGRKTAGSQAEITSEQILEHLHKQLPFERTNYMGEADAQMPTVQLDNDTFLGILELSSLDIEVPVLANYSQDENSEIPGRVEGSAYSNNLVILGSNLNSVFGQIGNMPDGAPVVFTDVEGHEFSYHVATAETMEVAQAEHFVEAANPWDLVLLTEQFSGENYLAILCLVDAPE